MLFKTQTALLMSIGFYLTILQTVYKLSTRFAFQKGIPWKASIHFGLLACCQTIHSNVELTGAQEITVS